MKKQMTICEPRISDALLTNPGIGFIAAPELMKAPGDQVRDNRGNPVAPYRFTPHSKTWNHPDSGVYYCGGRTYAAGTPILNVHIPAGEPLDVDTVRAAMEYAPRFYRAYFGQEFSLLHCHSWLLSPKLKMLLPEDSRIIRFQNLFTAFEADEERQAEERVFGFLAEDPAGYPENTSLQRKMKAALLAGVTFGMGRGIREIP